MANIKKYALGGGIAVVVILAIIISTVFGKLDQIVEEIVESVGSEVVGTEVALAGVKIDLTGGKAAIGGLTIANPAGFSEPYAFSLEGIAVDIDLASISKPPIIINAITVKAPEVWFETNAEGASNLDALLANLNSGAPAEEPETETGDPILLVIKKLDFVGGTMTAISAQSADNVEAVLPDIHMSGLGGSNGGEPGDIASVIIKEMVSKSVAAAIETGLKKKAEEGITDKLKGIFKKD
jgi:uncharacterized protein involved in outer membrane biogenesis